MSMNQHSSWRFGAKSAKRYTQASAKNSDEDTHDFSTSNLLTEYVKTDVDFASYVKKYVDNLLIDRPRIVPIDGEKVAPSTIRTYETQLRDVRFNKHLRPIAYSLILTGDAFIEVKFSGKRLTEMYVIDPNTMKIITEDDGRRVSGYIQEMPGKKPIPFDVDEIVHITIDQLDTGNWGYTFLAPLKEVLRRKQIAEYFAEWLVAKFKFKPLLVVESDNIMEDDWEKIVANMNMQEEDPDLYQIIRVYMGEKINGMSFFDPRLIDAIQKYIDEQKTQIITALQMPPIVAGNVDNSNRSNSEIQGRMVFYNSIYSFLTSLSEELTFELLWEKLKWRKVCFKVPNIDERKTVELIKVAKSLREDLGWTREAVMEYMKENGFNVPNVNTLFEPVVSEVAPTDGDDYPSRQPRDKTGIPQNEEQRLSDREAGVQ